MTPSKTILDETAQCFSQARQNLVKGASGLFKIKTEELWRDGYETYAEYLQDIQVSEGMASKLVSTFQFYVIENGIAPKLLEGVDHEKLYLSLRVPGDAKLKLSSAQTLSRGELRQVVVDPNDECQHPDSVTICSKCHKKI